MKPLFDWIEANPDRFAFYGVMFAVLIELLLQLYEATP